MRLTIGKKLYASFGTIILVIVVSSYFTLEAMKAADRGVSKLAEMIEDTDYASDMLRTMYRTQYYATEYLLTNDESSIAKYTTERDLAAQQLESCKQAIQNPERTRLLLEIEQAFIDYDTSFKSINAAIVERNTLINKQALVLGQGLTDSVHEYQKELVNAGNLEALRVANPLASHILEISMTAADFIRTRNLESLRETLDLIEASDHELEALATIDPSSKTFIENVNAQLHKY